jgi:uncharacterized cupin superfamily protein
LSENKSSEQRPAGAGPSWGIDGISWVDANVLIDDISPMMAPTAQARPAVLAGKRQFFTGSGATIGIWEGGPGEVIIESYPVDELWRILEGSVILSDATGHSHAFQAGDTFVLHKGFTGAARMPTKMRKLYASLATIREK